MPAKITLSRIAQNNLKLTRFIFIVCLIELWLSGITIRSLPEHNLTISLNASALILLSHVIRSRAAGIGHKERIVADPALLWIMAPFWSMTPKIGLRALEYVAKLSAEAKALLVTRNGWRI